MKLFTLILSTAVAAGALFAQTMDRISVRFPSPVVVSGVTLPAGDATIQIMHNTGTVFLAVRSESGETSTVLVSRAQSDESTTGPRVVFDQKDGTLQLNRIVLPDHTSLRVLDAQ
jgi:hypothetical protein